MPFSSTSHGLFIAQRSPSSLPVLLMPMTSCESVATTGEPEVPPMVSQPGCLYLIDRSIVQSASLSWYTVWSTEQS